MRQVPRQSNLSRHMREVGQVAVLATVREQIQAGEAEMIDYYIEWEGTFDTCALVNPETGKVTYIPYNFKVTEGPSIKEIEQ